MKTKHLIITRSVSGAGKSTFAKLLCEGRRGWVYCEADEFWYDNKGNYNFDINKLGAAHLWCQNKFLDFLKEPSVEVIVCSNTNTKERDWKFYEDEAKKRGMQVTFLILENRHGGENIHSVPEAALENQEKNILHSIKLR